MIIPAYNREELLPRAIASVRDQSYPPNEIIVVDDGSTDGTADVAIEHGCTLVRQENRGLAAARNAGARNTSSELLCFLDSDDQLLPHALETCHRYIIGTQDDALVPNFLIVSPSGRRPSWDPGISDYRLGRADVRALLKRNFLAGNGVMRRKAWEDNPYNESLRSAEDLDMWLQLLVRGRRVVRLSECLIIKEESSSSRLSNDVRTMRTSRLQVFQGWAARPELTIRERITALSGWLSAAFGVALSDLGNASGHLGKWARTLDSTLVRIAEQRQLSQGSARNLVDSNTPVDLIK